MVFIPFDYNISIWLKKLSCLMTSLLRSARTLDLHGFFPKSPCGITKMKITCLPTDSYRPIRRLTDPIGEMQPNEIGEPPPRGVTRWCSLCVMESASQTKRSSADITAPQGAIWWRMQRKQTGRIKSIRMFPVFPPMALSRFWEILSSPSIKAWRKPDLWIVLY